MSPTFTFESFRPGEPFYHIEIRIKWIQNERTELIIISLNRLPELTACPVTAALHFPAFVSELVKEVDEIGFGQPGQMVLCDRFAIVLLVLRMGIVRVPFKKCIDQFLRWLLHGLSSESSVQSRYPPASR